MGFNFFQGVNVKIICPECGFSRDVDEKKLPGNSVVATCPKCSCRFHLSIDGKTRPISGTRAPNDGAEEEDIRVVASKAYQKEADRFRQGQPEMESQPPARLNPWERAPGENGWFSAFFQTVAKVMFSAPAFFKTLTGQYSKPRVLSFYLLIIVFQTVVERLWGQFFLSVLAPGASGDPQLEKLLAMLSSDGNVLMGLILRCGLLILQLYIFTFLLTLAYKILAPKKASFGLLFQIMVYSSAPSILCVVPILGSLAGLAWGIGCLVAGCRAALALDWGRTLAGFLPVVFLIAPFLVQALNLARQ